MEATLFHFINEDKDDEYVVILEDSNPEEKEWLEDAKVDGYTLANKCPLENAGVTLPIGTILKRTW